jgi:hypothetical protein
MAWESTEWACGHKGAMQLYGKRAGRDSQVAYEAGRPCMACWLVEQWEQSNDPRAKREDRFKLAGDIAEGKGKRIYDLPESVRVSSNGDALGILRNMLKAQAESEALPQAVRKEAEEQLKNIQ